jgi:predicted HNH restriction endonuclease
MRNNLVSVAKYRTKEAKLVNGKLKDFHQWANNRPCKGAFLIETESNQSLWVVIVDWKMTENYYVALFPKSRSGPMAEIHESLEDNGEITLRWVYNPTKQDGKNAERRTYFEEVFKSREAFISVPAKRDELDDFYDELFSLATSRRKADDLDSDRPPVRDGFPEGKLKERLHRSRERNSEVIRQAKEREMEREGRLRCACCEFDFQATYGTVGTGFIEAHHTKPVSALHPDGEKTKIEDIALVCSNCHRMLHRRRPWLEMHQLSALLNDG